MPWDGDTTILTQRVREVASAGVLLGLAATALSLNGSTRVAGLALLPSAVGLLAAAGYAQRSGHWPNRTWVLAFVVLTVVAVGYAALVGLDAFAHRPIHAVPV